MHSIHALTLARLLGIDTVKLKVWWHRHCCCCRCRCCLTSCTIHLRRFSTFVLHAHVHFTHFAYEMNVMFQKHDMCDVWCVFLFIHWTWKIKLFINLFSCFLLQFISFQLWQIHSWIFTNFKWFLQCFFCVLISRKNSMLKAKVRATAIVKQQMMK